MVVKQIDEALREVRSLKQEDADNIILRETEALLETARKWIEKYKGDDELVWPED